MHKKRKDSQDDTFTNMEFKDLLEYIKALKNNPDKADKLLVPELCKEKFHLASYEIAQFITDSKKFEEFLTPQKCKELKLASQDIAHIIKDSGNIEKYLTPEACKSFGLKSDEITKLIKSSGNIDKYLTSENFDEFGLDSYYIAKLIKSTSNVEQYIDSEQLKKWGLNDDHKFKIELITKSRNVKKFLDSPELLEKAELSSEDKRELICHTYDIEKYLTPKKCLTELMLNSKDIAYLINKTGKIEEYLNPDKCKAFMLHSEDITELIKIAEKQEEFLEKPKYMQLFGLKNKDIADLIQSLDPSYLNYLELYDDRKLDEEGRLKKNYYIEMAKKYLEFAEQYNYCGLESEKIADQIERTGNIEEYLTPEKCQAFGLESKDIARLIKQTGKVEEYLSSGDYNLDDEDICNLIENVVPYKNYDKASIEKYLRLAEQYSDCGLVRKNIAKRITQTGEISKYLGLETFKNFGLHDEEIEFLIDSTSNPKQYLTRENCNKLGLKIFDVIDSGKVDETLKSYNEEENFRKRVLIRGTEQIEKYITPENYKEYNLDFYSICTLMKETNKMDEYLDPKKCEEYGFSQREIATMIRMTGEVEKYLTSENCIKYGLNEYYIKSLVDSTEKSKKEKDSILEELLQGMKKQEEIEEQKEKTETTFTEQEIGKSTIAVSVENKSEAESSYRNDIKNKDLKKEGK